MMIKLINVDTHETFAEFGDNEVKLSLKTARESGKIVNMELDDEHNKDALIYIQRRELHDIQ